MSKSVRESIVIAAEPQVVWDTIMDPGRLGEWVSLHRSVADGGEGIVGEGDSFTQKMRLAGKSFKVRWQVVEADSPRFARWLGEGPAGSSASVSYKLTANGEGTCFDYCNDFALPGGALGKAAGGLLSAAPGSREAKRSLDRLKELLEQG
jgi:carbon monoxide dehydrogenase subunit G